MGPEDFDGFDKDNVTNALKKAYDKRSAKDRDYDQDADVDARALTYKAEIFVVGNNPLSGYGVVLNPYP